MPTYEYQCESCGHRFEKFQSIMAPAIRKCPECGKQRVKRLLGTGAGIIFKGSGFYITDYRSESYKNAAKADNGSPASAPAATGDAKTGDAKPASNEAKTETKPATNADAKPSPTPQAASSSAKKESKRDKKK